MAFIIRKKFSFSAAHQLKGLPETHPCSRLHGHNYEIEIVLSDMNLDKHGFVLDYRKLDQFKRFIDQELDHRNLNDVFSGMQTTAENLAHILYLRCLDYWPQTRAVLVSETPKTWAEYTEHVL